MKYSKKDFVHIFAILMSSVLLYLTIQELRVALSGSSASAQTVPCTSPTPSNPPSATPSASSTTSPSPAPSNVPIDSIFLTEFMACPETGSEWLELYNASSTAVTVTNWLVIDAANNKKIINGSIPPNSFVTFEWSGSLLNNSGDEFTLQTATGLIIAQASYNSCTPGISFVYENGEWVGALDSPEQDTLISENTLNEATVSAEYTLQVSDTSKADTVSELNQNDFENTQLSLSLPIPSITPPDPPLSSQQAPNAENISSQPAKISKTPVISVILGGILQLAMGSYALYEAYIKEYV